LDELFVLGEHCTRTERRAEAAERELIRVKLLTYLEHHIGVTFHAIITGVEDFGLFCRLVEMPVEGLLHVSSLADDYYYLESGTHTLIGRSSGRRHRLGDRIEIRIAHVDVDRRELDLVLADTPISRGSRSQPAEGVTLPEGARSLERRRFRGRMQPVLRQGLPAQLPGSGQKKKGRGKLKLRRNGKKRKR
jgi:ribonuclease R